MILLKLKGKVSESRLRSVLEFLKSMKIDVEVADAKSRTPVDPTQKLTLHAGLWKDYDTDATELRRNAWKPK
jgi:hypothetical protein